MLHKEIWGLTILGFILWIFLGTAQQRLERTCAPLGWGGNVTVSLAALVVPSYQQPIQKWFDKFTYGCQYTTWRLFYQDEFNKWKEQQKALEGKDEKATGADGETVEKIGENPKNTEAVTADSGTPTVPPMLKPEEKAKRE